ncbi:MAG TPA: hypothetical protein VF495_01795 [Phenylobacterium sp.]|jgi:hypothetical protein
MAPLRPPKSPHQHDAVRDTQWVGKGVRMPWLLVLAIVAVAIALAMWLR